MNEEKYCLFCDRENKNEHIIISETELVFAKWDKNPASKGHLLVIPKRHVVSFFDLTNEEIIAVYDLLKKMKLVVLEEYKPDGFNIGVNEGEVAGRTVHHLHFHLIPRYKGDVDNPKGGIRNIISGSKH